MSREPTSLSTEALPSSFDSDPDFHSESRSTKLFRKLRQEPLIPLGCLATCYALFLATRSIRAGDKNQTNKMFRARIYAQGFTLAAIVAGSFFYQDERMKRRGAEKEVEKVKAAEKRDKWLRELEARDAEDQAWRARIERESGEAVERAERAERMARSREGAYSSKSVREQVGDEGWGLGQWVMRTREAWRRV